MRQFTPVLKTYFVNYCENLTRKETTIKAFSKAGARVLFTKSHDMKVTSIIQLKEMEGEKNG